MKANNFIVFGGLLLLLIFGCIGNQTQNKTDPLGKLGDSDISPQRPPSEPQLPVDDLVVEGSADTTLTSDESDFIEINETILAGEDVLIEPE